MTKKRNFNCAVIRECDGNFRSVFSLFRQRESHTEFLGPGMGLCSASLQDESGRCGQVL